MEIFMLAFSLFFLLIGVVRLALALDSLLDRLVVWILDRL